MPNAGELAEHQDVTQKKSDLAGGNGKWYNLFENNLTLH